MIRIDVRPALKALTRDFDTWQKVQIPFATAQALNATAARVAQAETAGLAETFKDPTPFTQRGPTVLKARKSDLVAQVIMKDVQAKYLASYLDGGPQYLGAKRAILKPVDIKLNAYGNIPRGKLAALKARGDIFIGPVTIRGQTINGVWLRPSVPNGMVKGRRGVTKAPAARGRLTLLIRFDDPKPVTQRLPWGQRAEQVVARWLAPDFAAAYAQAVATARPTPAP